MNQETQEPAPRRSRGARADAESPEAIYLIKHVSSLRATHQIRLLALKAVESGKDLVLMVPRTCRFDPSLEALCLATSGAVRREDLP
jgi:hypothetical protein